MGAPPGNFTSVWFPEPDRRSLSAHIVGHNSIRRAHAHRRPCCLPQPRFCSLAGIMPQQVVHRINGLLLKTLGRQAIHAQMSAPSHRLVLLVGDSKQSPGLDLVLRRALFDESTPADDTVSQLTMRLAVCDVRFDLSSARDG